MYHVGTVTEIPLLHLPTELANLPDDLDSLKRIPLEVSFLTVTEGIIHISITVQYLQNELTDCIYSLILKVCNVSIFCNRSGSALGGAGTHPHL